MWNGKLYGDVGEATQHADVLLHTAPRLVHAKAGSSLTGSAALCTIATYAEGIEHLRAALTFAHKARVFMAQNSSHHAVCGSVAPTVVLYAFRFNEELDSIAQSQSPSGTNNSLAHFQQAFDAIWEVPTDSEAVWLPPDNEVDRSLRQTRQDRFHHSVSLWWRRLTARLHTPSPYVMWADADMLACAHNFDAL